MSDGYWQLVKAWDAALGRPLSDDAKRVECLAILRAYVARRAAARLGQPNPALRFYADMISQLSRPLSR